MNDMAGSSRDSSPPLRSGADEGALVQPVVLCGGSGTGLWPLSREQHPKQLLPLFGEDSMLQATVRRVDAIAGLKLAVPMVVCNEEYRFVVAEQLRLVDKSAMLLLEPVGRNTAPALTLAALAARQAGADPVLLVMPADHVIADTQAFEAAVVEGASLAEAGVIVTFGIAPTSAQSEYGYIRTGAAFDRGAALRIAGFVEKPDPATAQAYLDAGSHLWNSGMFMLRVSVWLQAIGSCGREILAACEAAWEKRSADGDFLRVGSDEFARCPSDSIDYAVLERLGNGEAAALAAAVVPLAAGWGDIDAWDALWRALPKDESGNVARGDVLLQACRNTLVVSAGRLVACVGLDDLVVVETADAVLIAHKGRTDGVKSVVDRLNRDGRAEVRLHRKVYRPWGSYDGVDAGERFLVKRIVVNPGASLSLQMHHHRAEHWVVVRGTAKVTREDAVYLVSENESTFIPLGRKHRLENPGRLPLEMIEVQSGSYLGEDDIVRFDDRYGR